jgi:hypothetical protein
MVDESGEAGPAAAAGTAKKRPAVAIGVAAFIMFLVVVLYLYSGITALFDLGVLGSGPVLPLVEGDSLTEAGRTLVAAGFELAYGVGSLVILIGFLRGQRWAWVAAMTWITVSLAIGLWRYFADRPQYLSMFALVVLVLVLNLSAVHRAFNIGRR